MRRDPRAWLLDILAACDLLADFTRGKTFEDYADDALLRSGVERKAIFAFELSRIVSAVLQSDNGPTIEGSPSMQQLARRTD